MRGGGTWEAELKLGEEDLMHIGVERLSEYFKYIT